MEHYISPHNGLALNRMQLDHLLGGKSSLMLELVHLPCGIELKSLYNLATKPCLIQIFVDSKLIEFLESESQRESD